MNISVLLIILAFLAGYAMDEIVRAIGRAAELAAKQSVSKPHKPSIVTRQFSESVSHGDYIAPRMGVLRKLWIAIPEETRWITVSTDAYQLIQIDTQFLPHLSESRACVHLERLCPALANFHLENVSQLRIHIEPIGILYVHREIAQVWIAPAWEE